MRSWRTGGVCVRRVGDTDLTTERRETPPCARRRICVRAQRPNYGRVGQAGNAAGERESRPRARPESGSRPGTRASRARNSAVILPDNASSLSPATATATTSTEYSIGTGVAAAAGAAVIGARPRVFVSYASEDNALASRLSLPENPSGRPRTFPRDLNAARHQFGCARLASASLHRSSSCSCQGEGEPVRVSRL